MKRYDIIDTRDEFGNWSVIDNRIHRQNPFNWRKSIVFRGKKSEVKAWIVEHEKDSIKSTVLTGEF